MYSTFAGAKGGIVARSGGGSWDFSLEGRGEWRGGCEWVFGGGCGKGECFAGGFW